MRYDNCLNGITAQILFDKLHRGLSALHAHGGIEHYPASVALDHSQVSHVVTAHLINALTYLEQAVLVVVLGIFPQAGVYAVGRFFIVVQEFICCLAPYHLAILIEDFQIFGRVYQAALGELGLLSIAEIQFVIHRRVDLRGVLGRGLYVFCKAQIALCKRGRGHAGQHKRRRQHR